MAPSIYPCLDEMSIVSRIGGAEVQQAALGRQLVKRGIEVSYVTMDDSHPDTEVTTDFEIYPAFRRTDGIPGLRFLFTRVPGFWRALKRADSDIYYVRGASYLAGIVSTFARLNGRKFIFAGASDADFDPGSLRLRYIRDKWLYKCGLRYASKIVVQSTVQSKLLKRNFGLDSTVIPNVVPSAPIGGSTSRSVVLWVANLRKLKQPMQFLTLAELFPDERFVMIGGLVSSEPETYHTIKAAAHLVPNLEFLGSQKFGETEKYFDRAKILVNTSVSEGFPNTFLQAWCRGVPVISYIDPDSFIEHYRLGRKVMTEAGLAEAIRLLSDWDAERSKRIAGFCNAHFNTRPIKAFLDVLLELSR